MKRLFAILAVCALSVSCEDILDEVSFEVIPAADNIYEAGREIRFRFLGNPDNITFYSGEAGLRYEYANSVDGEGTANFGVAVKSISARTDSFTYVWQTSGAYEVVFVGSNVTYEGESRKTIRIPLTISSKKQGWSAE